MGSLQLEIVRKRKGISLEKIAEETKISTQYLRAIECEEFSKLPGGVFNSNYIRQYARQVGFPETKLLARYDEAEADRVRDIEENEKRNDQARSGWRLRFSFR